MGRIRQIFHGIRRLVPTLAEARAVRWELALSLLSGLAGAFLFPRYHVSTLAWVALVPWFFALARLEGRAVFWSTLLFGVPWYYLSLWWLNTLTIFNPFIPLGAIALPVVLTLYFLLFAYPASWVLRRQPGWLAPVTVAAIWSGVEYLRSLGEVAFPWNLLGYSQGQGPMRAFVQWAEVGGVYIVSFFVALWNASLAGLVRRVVERRPGETAGQAFLPGFVSWLGPGSLVLLGWICALGLQTNARREAEYRSQDQTSATVTLAVVQPNVSQLEKWEAGAPDTPAARRREIELSAMHRALSAVQVLGATMPDGSPLGGAAGAGVGAADTETGATTETRSADAETTTAATSSTAPARRRPQLYILPETAFLTPSFVYETHLHQMLQTVAQEVEADIFFGADAREPREGYLKRLRQGFRTLAPGDIPTTFTLPRILEERDPAGNTTWREPGDMAAFNSAWMVTPERGLSDYVYHKVQLVPFGETAPILGHIPGFQEFVMTVGSFQSGLEQTMFESSGIRFGAMICFESSFGYLARGLANSGARMIVVLTNDAWYNPAYLIDRGGVFGTLFRLPLLGTLASSGPDQHFQMSVFRTIETRLPLVRSANTGISAIIDSTGRVVDSRPYGTAGTMVADVSAPYHKPTAYVRRGDSFALLCLAVALFVTGYEVFTRRRSRRKEAAA